MTETTNNAVPPDKLSLHDVYKTVQVFAATKMGAHLPEWGEYRTSMLVSPHVVGTLQDDDPERIHDRAEALRPQESAHTKLACAIVDLRDLSIDPRLDNELRDLLASKADLLSLYLDELKTLEDR